jgi:hypothetical protein
MSAHVKKNILHGNARVVWRVRGWKCKFDMTFLYHEVLTYAMVGMGN